MKMTEQQIQKKYQDFMQMELLELIKNLEDFIQPYQTESSFFNRIDCYVDTLSKEEQERYKKRKNDLKIHKSYYAQVVYQYLKGDKNDFSPFCNLKPSDTKIALERYLKYFPEYEKEIQYVKENIFHCCELGFLEELKIYLNNSRVKYINVLVPLIFSTKAEAIQSLRRQRIPKNFFETYVKCFQAKFPNQQKLVYYLEELYQEYSKLYPLDTKKQNIVTSHSELFQKIYSSGMSVEEYCFDNGGNINQTRKIISGFVVEQKNEILARDNSNFVAKVKNIIEAIVFDKLDYLDYYQLTKLDLTSLLVIVKSFNLEKEHYKKVFQFINKGKMIERDNRIIESAQLEKLTKYGDREITKDEKEKIFAYLKENEIPLCYYNFALTKYVKGELNFGKQLEKKANL